MTVSPEAAFRVLNWLRSIAIVGQLVAIAAAHGLFTNSIRVLPLIAVTLAFVAWHAALHHRISRGSLLDATRLTKGNRPWVDFSCASRGSLLVIKIRDYGRGFAPVDHSSQNGMGIGLVISSATLERAGGEARHYARQPGTEVVVTLPIREDGTWATATQ